MLNFNKKYLSALIASVFVLGASSANAATVYSNDTTSFEVGGRMQANINSVHASKNDDKGDIAGKVRLRLKGSSTVYEDIKAVGFVEWEVAAATSQDGKYKTRYAYTGFESPTYGQLVFGQNDTAMYNVQGKTDLFTDWGNSGNTYWDLGNGDAVGGHEIKAGRQEGQVFYLYNNYNFTIGAAYQTAGLTDVNGGYSLSLGYDIPLSFPVGIHVAYDSYDLVKNYDDRETIAGALTGGVDGEGFYIAGMVNVTSYDRSEDRVGYEIVSSYTMDNSLKFIVGYEHVEADSAILVSDFVGEVSYNLATNFKTFLEVQVGCSDIDVINTLNQKIGTTGEASDSKFSVGLQYNF